MRPRKLRVAPPARNNAVILFWVGPHRFGIPARSLREIRNDRGLPPEEFGCWTILSAHRLFGLALCTRTPRLLVLNHSRIAIRVDHVEKMIEAAAPAPLPQGFHGAERQWYSGLGLIDETVFPMVNPEAMEDEAMHVPEEPLEWREAS